MAGEPLTGEVSESVRAAPAAPLRGLLSWYSGYRQEGVPPGRHRGLPSPYLTVIITLGDPLTVARHPDPADPPGEYATLAGGLHTRPAIITHPGRQSGIQLALSPLGARALLGCPAGALAGIDVDGSEVLGDMARELHERLGEAGSWPARFALLDQILLDHADLDRQVTPDVAEAWRLLTRSGGTVRAGELARRVGWSPRYLQRRLQAETGLTPKAAARVTRFDRARRTLQRQATAPAGPAPPPPRPASAWPAWPPSAVTTTRPTWPGSSASWPAAPHPGGWPRSSETSNPALAPGRETDDHER